MTRKVKTNKMNKMKMKNKTKHVHFNSHVTVRKIEPTNASQLQSELDTMTGPVLIHSPGCIHCIELRPKWEQVIKELNNRKIVCKVLEVNANALSMSNNSLEKRMANMGVPTIINMETGKENAIFSDERNVDNMLQFVLKHLKGKNKNLSYNYNLNEKGNIFKLTDPNNIKRVRKQNPKPKTRKTRKIRKNRRY
jgi:thiol-disulfide isomerase/thioredoxin